MAVKKGNGKRRKRTEAPRGGAPEAELEEFVPIGVASRLLGVSITTLRRLEKSGKLLRYGVHVYYTPTGRRRYRRRELVKAIEQSAKRES